MGLVLSVGEKMRKITTTLTACVMKCSNFCKHVGHIPGNSCICRAHCTEAERQHLNPELCLSGKKTKLHVNVAQQSSTCLYVVECAVVRFKE